MKNESKTKVLKGIVVRKKSLKTVIVRVDRKVLHKIYKKVLIKSSNFHVHDEINLCKEGDLVFIKECCPFSKMKSWLLLEIIDKNVNNEI